MLYVAAAVLFSNASCAVMCGFVELHIRFVRASRGGDGIAKRGEFTRALY